MSLDERARRVVLAFAMLLTITGLLALPQTTTPSTEMGQSQRGMISPGGASVAHFDISGGQEQDVKVSLESSGSIDLQLWDGQMFVLGAPELNNPLPVPAISSRIPVCSEYVGTRGTDILCYSGYEGGNEYITISGIVQNSYTIRMYALPISPNPPPQAEPRGFIEYTLTKQYKPVAPSTITGRVQSEDAVPVEADVAAYRCSDGAKRGGTVVTSAGAFSVAVNPGAYYVVATPRSSDYQEKRSDCIAVDPGQTRIIVVTVSRATCVFPQKRLGTVQHRETRDISLHVSPSNGSVELKLSANVDIDLQLWDGASKVVGSGSTPKTVLINSKERTTGEYKGDTIEYSGYNGGSEWIIIHSPVRNSYQVKIFGQAPGQYEVTLCKRSL
jgi:hypothetical protein